jgi:hypothetical protein
VNGKTDDEIADYLVSVEVDEMGLDSAPDVRERALVVASAISTIWLLEPLTSSQTTRLWGN